jgi:hypothetical protein
MTDIVDARAVKFCNEQIRPLSDQVVATFYRSQSVLDLWMADPALQAAFATDADVVQDGAVNDGRTVIDAAAVKAFMTSVAELNGYFRANNQSKLNSVLKTAVRV